MPVEAGSQAIHVGGFHCIRHPFHGYFPDFFQCPEQVHVQHFCPVGFVEPLDIAVLHRSAGLDVFQYDVVLFRPARKLD